MAPLLEISHVTMEFPQQTGTLTVLQDISLTVEEGDFIAVVGPSGCGKSTLLRLLNGLAQPTQGSILFRGQPIQDVNLETSMVFQSFALLPWLTVEQNVALGLEARGYAPQECRRRADFFIDKMGLEGYEEAYPRELSAGMKQRAGLARALAVEPALLLMDEPFSALDALTALNLREEVLDLWRDPTVRMNTVMLVTHNIEEAVEMVNRVVVLSRQPGHVIADIRVDLPKPRDKRTPEFIQMVDRIFSTMTPAPRAASGGAP